MDFLLTHHQKAWQGGSKEDPVGLRPHFLLEKNYVKQLSSPGVDILPPSSVTQSSILWSKVVHMELLNAAS